MNFGKEGPLPQAIEVKIIGPDDETKAVHLFPGYEAMLKALAEGKLNGRRVVTELPDQY